MLFRSSTLRVSKKGAVTPDDADDVDILPFAAKHIKRMKDAGYLVAIVSNQGGIAAGKQTFPRAEAGLVRTVTMLAKLKGNVDYFDFAEALDEFRKPEIGMAEALEEAVEKGRFRQDLYYRLMVVEIELPHREVEEVKHPRLARLSMKLHLAWHPRTTRRSERHAALAAALEELLLLRDE